MTHPKHDSEFDVPVRHAAKPRPHALLAPNDLVYRDVDVEGNAVIGYVDSIDDATEYEKQTFVLQPLVRESATGALERIVGPAPLTTERSALFTKFA